MDAPRHLLTKVVGVTDPNADGSSRQEVLALCSPGEKLDLVHDAGNPKHPGTIEVRRTTGEQLGYLNDTLADEVAARQARGWRAAGYLVDITGEDGNMLGANILIVIATPGVKDEDARAYLDKLVKTDVRVMAAAKDQAPSKGCLVVGALVGMAVALMLVVFVASFAGADDRLHFDLVDGFHEAAIGVTDRGRGPAPTA